MMKTEEVPVTKEISNAWPFWYLDRMLADPAQKIAKPALLFLFA